MRFGQRVIFFFPPLKTCILGKTLGEDWGVSFLLPTSIKWHSVTTMKVCNNYATVEPPEFKKKKKKKIFMNHKCKLKNQSYDLVNLSHLLISLIYRHPDRGGVNRITFSGHSNFQNIFRYVLFQKII